MQTWHGITSPFGVLASGANVITAYAANNITPQLVGGFQDGIYAKNSARSAFSDVFTATRASTATYVDSTGTLQTAAINEARTDAHYWDGSAFVKGFLKEKASTNTLTNSQLDGAVVGTIGAGGVLPTGFSASGFDTVEVVSIDTYLGAPRIRLKGTRSNVSGSSEFPFYSIQTGVPCSAETTYTPSLFYKDGPDLANLTSGPNIIIDDNVSVNYNVFSTIGFTAGFDDMKFVYQSGTTTAGATEQAFRIAATVATGTTGVFDILISTLQLEEGSIPTSYIPTAGTAVTRAADVVTIPIANVPYPEPVVITTNIDDDFTAYADQTAAIAAGYSFENANVTFNAVNNSVDWSGDGGFDFDGAVLSPLISGSVYRIAWTQTGRTTGQLFLQHPVGTNITNNSADGDYTAFLVYNGSGAFRLAGGGSYDGSITNISVQEINPLSVSFAMEGVKTYSDNDATDELIYYRWQADASNNIRARLRTDFGTGRYDFLQAVSGTTDFVSSGVSDASPGVNVPFSIASRHGTTFINGAVDGTALTADLTPVAFPDLSATDIDIAPTFNGFITLFRMWGDTTGNIGDVGIAGASA